MTVLSLIAFVFGVLGVWLTIKQSIWCWPISMISVLASVVEFYNEKLFGDMSLQVFYFAAALYGWVYWKQQQMKDFVVSKLPLHFLPIVLLITALQSGLYFLLLKYFEGDRPLFDAVLTASSLTATYMMTRKWVENWLAWVFIDSAYVVLYALKFMWMFSILYLVFTIVALVGWIKWRKIILLK